MRIFCYIYFGRVCKERVCPFERKKMTYRIIIVAAQPTKQTNSFHVHHFCLLLSIFSFSLPIDLFAWCCCCGYHGQLNMNITFLLVVMLVLLLYFPLNQYRKLKFGSTMSASKLWEWQRDEGNAETKQNNNNILAPNEFLKMNEWTV